MTNLLRFPTSTYVGKAIPKSKFIAASAKPTAMREFLTREIEAVHLLNVLRYDNVGVTMGDKVSEIDVFHFRTKSDSYDDDMLCQLDALMPRHTMMVVEHGGKADLLMQHKERVERKDTSTWRVVKTITLRDVDLLECPVRLEGTDMDSVYFGLLSALSGYEIDREETMRLVNQLEADLEQKTRAAAALKKKLHAEKQYNIQRLYNKELRKLNQEITEITTRLEDMRKKP
ncbi:MAG: DUF4391 domain-containing protein [Bacteroidales bacterium]|nr:DUF4391 domain-containing protein [Bacteroidales bacterium]